MSTTTTQSQTTTTNAVAENLKKLLADSYSLMAQTHLAHWNVEGPAFFQLHTAFQTHYEELFTAIDELAERLRALDVLAPGGLTTFSRLASVPERDSGPALAKDFVAHLVEGHETVLASAKTVRDSAEKAHDLETQDMAIARIQTHEKTLWMLKSYLKNL